MKKKSQTQNLSVENKQALRDRLTAFVAIEATDPDEWRRRCPDPDCRLAAIVKASEEERPALIAKLTNDEVLELLARHMECYEDRVLNSGN